MYVYIYILNELGDFRRNMEPDFWVERFGLGLSRRFQTIDFRHQMR